MSATELKPCPFCGGKAIRSRISDGGSVIQCSGCYASTAVHYDRCENLVPAWNERNTPEGMALVPREITAESGHKAGVMGDFVETIEDCCPECGGSGHEDGDDCELCEGSGGWLRKVTVTWITIKAIHRRIVEIAEAEKAGRKR